jgi:hypothetical protein
MNIDDATYADAPKHPRIDRPINPVAKMICQGGIKPWATTSCRNLGENIADCLDNFLDPTND